MAKGIDSCPKCWGTGLVGGFQTPCHYVGQEIADTVVRNVIRRTLAEFFRVHKDEIERLMASKKIWAQSAPKVGFCSALSYVVFETGDDYYEYFTTDEEIEGLEGFKVLEIVE